MAYKNFSFLLAPVFLVSILLAIAGQAGATRDIPRNPKNDDLMKQPEFLGNHDRSVLIPGLGRVLLPPVLTHHNPHTGSIGSNIGGQTGGTGYIPGGDDIFVPHPGFEVPIPGNGAGSTGALPHP